jgi:hypothetical protein
VPDAHQGGAAAARQDVGRPLTAAVSRGRLESRSRITRFRGLGGRHGRRASSRAARTLRRGMRRRIHDRL